MWGLTVEEASGPPVEVFPDNWQTVNVFLAMDTQWREGKDGPVGLDYGVLLGKHGVMALCGVRRGDRKDVFSGIQIMEAAALDYMNQKRG
jgi:hypothetical protein